MTITVEPGTRYPKTNPECAADRHRPEHTSFRRGCRCADTVMAEDAYQKLKTEELEQRRIRCRGKWHADTDHAWRMGGCRCPGAVAAHEQARRHVRVSRADAVAHWKRTGECGASAHDTRSAFRKSGCRCPLARKLEEQCRESRTKDHRVNLEHSKPRRPVVGRFNMLMLDAGYGFVDPPTLGEILVGDIHLSRISVVDGPWLTRKLTILEIAERLGTTDRMVYRVRRTRSQLRAERHLRRLGDVRAKAGRVKPQRKQAEAERHVAAWRRKTWAAFWAGLDASRRALWVRATWVG